MCLVVCALLCVQKFCKLAVLGRLKTICHFVLSRRVFGCFRCFWLASGLRVVWGGGNPPTECCRIHLYRFFHLGYLQWSLKHTQTHTHPYSLTHTHQLTYYQAALCPYNPCNPLSVRLFRFSFISFLFSVFISLALLTIYSSLFSFFFFCFLVFLILLLRF